MFDSTQNAGRPPEGGASAGAAGDRPRDTRAACSRPAAELLGMLGNAELVDQAIQDREAEFRVQYQPRNGVEDWLIHDMARHSLDIDVQRARLVRDTARLIDQAQNETSWDDVRKSEALDLMARIARAPARVVAALERTKQGVDVLLSCYYQLRTIIAERGAIDDQQRSLLFDLAGVAPGNREGNTRVPAADDGARLAELVAHQIQRLETKRDIELVSRDRSARNRAINGVILTPDAVTRQLRRDLAAATRGLKWAYKLLMDGRNAAAATAAATPAATAAASTGCTSGTEARHDNPSRASQPAGSRPARPAAQAAAAPDSPASAPPADAGAGADWDPESGMPEPPHPLRDELAAQLHGEQKEMFLLVSDVYRARMRELHLQRQALLESTTPPNGSDPHPGAD